MAENLEEYLVLSLTAEVAVILAPDYFQLIGLLWFTVTWISLLAWAGRLA